MILALAANSAIAKTKPVQCKIIDMIER